jgi:hypothetical protein
MTTHQKPVHTVKLGLIEAAVWRNDADGVHRYNVTVKRSYAVKQGERLQWSSTDSFGRDDLLGLAKAVDLAHSWILKQPRTARPAAPAT